MISQKSYDLIEKQQQQLAQLIQKDSKTNEKHVTIPPINRFPTGQSMFRSFRNNLFKLNHFDLLSPK